MFRPFRSKTADHSPAARVYLDYASATPVLPEVIQAMSHFWSEDFGNASAIHSEGVRAKTALIHAREAVAKILQVKPDGITFTSGGTESNNLAIVGTIERVRTEGVPYSDMEIITTRLEHPATLKTVAALECKGVTVRYAPVDERGRIILAEFTELLSLRTRIVTVAYVNSEIGTIEDIGALHRLIAAKRREGGTAALLHVDAAQAPMWLPCELPRLGADLLSLDSGKFGGPKGVGILAHGKGVAVEAVVYGGGQEAGLRPGTEAVPLIVGCSTALEIVQACWKERQEAVSRLRDDAIKALQNAIPGLFLNGARGEERVANNINVSIPGLSSEFAVISLDVAGIACSTKSACSAAGGGESTVVKAVTGDSARAASTLRFTLGPDTTTAQINQMIVVLKTHAESQKSTIV